MFEEEQEVENAGTGVQAEMPQRGNSTQTSRAEGAEAPEEMPQRRTSTRIKTRTKLYGIDDYIDFVDAEAEKESVRANDMETRRTSEED